MYMKPLFPLLRFCYFCQALLIWKPVRRERYRIVLHYYYYYYYYYYRYYYNKKILDPSLLNGLMRQTSSSRPEFDWALELHVEPPMDLGFSWFQYGHTQNRQRTECVHIWEGSSLTLKVSSGLKEFILIRIIFPTTNVANNVTIVTSSWKQTKLATENQSVFNL